MVFSDQIFLFAFLPLALAFCLPAMRTRIGPFLILLFSLFFFFWSSGSYTILLVVSIAINYLGGLALAWRRRKGALIAVVTLNFLLLGFFKYTYFFVSQFDHLLTPGIVGAASLIVLPIGISFYTFQGVSYVIDVWRGEIEAERNPILFGAYLSFFPQLIAGPIVRYADVAADFRDPKISLDLFTAGASRFMVGLLKKIVIADSVARIADASFATTDPGFADAWIGGIAYTIQIYFDFSGYSDMAIGLGMMFGIRFPENFRHPYAAQTVTEFWRRWHISLSSWFRDYLYIPLGGNRAGTGATYRNLLIVFLATGLWHGAAWTFVFWGLWHGLFLIGERLVLGGRAAAMNTGWMRPLYLLPVIVIGWVMFRAENMDQFLQMAEAMVSPLASGAFAFSPMLDTGIDRISITALAFGCIAIGLQPYLMAFGPALSADMARPLVAASRLAFVSAGAAVTMLMVIPNSYSPFLYFRF